jgi:hypothetical protein
MHVQSGHVGPGTATEILVFHLHGCACVNSG